MMHSCLWCQHVAIAYPPVTINVVVRMTVAYWAKAPENIRKEIKERSRGKIIFAKKRSATQIASRSKSHFSFKHSSIYHYRNDRTPVTAQYHSHHKLCSLSDYQRITSLTCIYALDPRSLYPGEPALHFSQWPESARTRQSIKPGATALAHTHFQTPQ